MTQATALSVTPLSVEKSALTAQLVEGLDSGSLTWLSGYMAGLAANHGERAGVAIANPAAATTQAPRVTVLYGSQTGNAKRVAEQLAEQLQAEGLEARLVRTDAYPLHELKKERHLYVVISTHSTGDDIEPPDDSRAFVEFLSSRRAPKLVDLEFAVLALGDSSYPDFCGIGRKVDARLDELGAQRLFDLGEADVDIDSIAQPWSETALDKARAWRKDASSGVPASGPSAVVTPLHPARTAWTRSNPFEAEVLANQRIVANESGKDIRHIELSLEGSGIHYQPGDALGVWPTQSSELVESVLDTLKLDGDAAVTIKNETLPLAQWLRSRREITTVTRPFLATLAELGEHADLKALLAPEQRDRLGQLLEHTQLLDVLRAHPADWDAQALIEALRPLAPRSYSIASSQAQVDEEVHLTVALLHTVESGEDRYGAATRYLCDRREGEHVPVFVDANDRFRLPSDPSRDIIMIGPGTGVAPFRAFVQERAITGASGRNWLIFGNPHRRTDFLYQLEWQQARKQGHLHRLDVAFSRDQANKVYVQHRIAEAGRTLWEWLEGGAHLYVCGDADRMAPDVHAALEQLAVDHGDKSPEAAAQWLNGLLTEGRYARDVY